MKQLYYIVLLAFNLLLLSGCTTLGSSLQAHSLANTAQSIGGKVVTQHGQLVMILPSDKLFRPGGTRLTANSYQFLTNVANILLHEYPKANIKVVAHTDSSGSPQRNVTISMQRSRAVAGYLRYRGIHRDQLNAIGLGDAHPITANHTPAERAQNRRIEIYISS